MADISEDGFWKSVNGEWIPTEKQLDAIDNGAIPHNGAMTELGKEESADLDSLDSKNEHAPLLPNNSELNVCAACGNEFEGKNARNCPGRKCRNPICLKCDPLETSFQKKVGTLGTVIDIVTGDIASLVGDKVEGEMNISKVRCKQCVKRDQREDVMLISALLSFIFAFFLLAIMKLFLPFSTFILYLLAYSISFYLLMKLLYKFYSIHLEFIAPLLRRVPSKFKNIITVASGTVGAGIFLILLIGSGTDHSDNAIVGEWYSTVETLEFQSDGDVIHSDSSVVGWRVQNGDLILQWAEDDEYYYKYQISEEFLFVVPYADSELSTVSENDCLVMSDDANAKNQSYWDEVNINPPEWCKI